MANESQPIRVLIADEQKRYLDVIAAAVESLGHQVVSLETEIGSVGNASIKHMPDVAIVVLHEDTEHALELVSGLVDEATCPVVVLAKAASAEFVAEAARRGVFAHLDSSEPDELQGGIDVAVQRYREYRDLLMAFDRRARIERAKGVLMERHMFGDREAFEHIRQRARDSRRPLIEVVDELLSVKEESVYDPTDTG